MNNMATTIKTKKNAIPFVKLQDGSKYPIVKLLGAGDTNAKMSKSDKSGKGYLTYGLSLAPGNVSGYEVCPSRSPGCSAACLYTAGHGQMTSVQRARTAKTIMFFEQRKAFLAMLERDLDAAHKKATKENKTLAIRLNVLSDIPWESIAPKLLSKYTDVQKYDYTKSFKRMKKFCAGGFPPNYHLTFSRSECNDKESLEVLKMGGNVAVVFDNKDIPKEWNGFKVVNGDETDLRFLDEKGVVVGLFAKGKGRTDKSGFVVSTKIPLQMAA